MKRGVTIALPIVVALAIIGLFAALVNGKVIDVLQPTGEIALAQRDLLIGTLFLSSLVVLPVFTLLIYFSIKYRAGNTKADYQPEWGENRILEGLWWGIPIAIIGVLGVLTYHTSHSLDPYKPLAGDKPLKIQVVALRWKWLFIYPEQQVASLNYFVAPVDRPIMFSLSADAPMSAFWIPSLGSQIYAMNGMESELNLRPNKIGIYTGYTTNINGEGYSRMTFKAKIKSTTDFASWLKASRNSQVGMDQKQYELLSKPISETDERSYRLVDASLFDTIVHKNMSHSSDHNANDKTNATAHKGHHE